MNDLLGQPGWRRRPDLLLAFVVLAVLVFAAHRAVGFVIVPFEQLAEVVSPEDGEIIFVPSSAPFADVRVKGYSRLDYFATNDAAPLSVFHESFLTVAGVTLILRETEIVPPLAFGDLFGFDFFFAQTYRLGVGQHVAQIAHEIFTPDLVIRGIAVDTNVFYIVPVDMPVPPSAALLGVALLGLAVRRVRGLSPRSSCRGRGSRRYR
jgi:hypothetical protein